MLRGLYTSASAMTVQMERQNTIANNLSNVDTKGYKKNQTVIKQFPEFTVYRKDDQKEINPFETVDKNQKIGLLGTGAIIQDIYTEFEQGDLEATGNDLDFAINGDEFFLIETSTGIKATRNGSFAIDSQGYLITKFGGRVLGLSEQGTAGYIKLGEEDLVVGKNGKLQTGEIVGNVDIGNIEPIRVGENRIFSVEIENTQELSAEGYNYYSLKDVTNIKAAKDVDMNQGFLESSTVFAVKEMVEMLACSRSYETNQKILTYQDEALGKVINEVGKWGG